MKTNDQKDNKKKKRVKTRRNKVKKPGRYSTVRCWCGKPARSGGFCDKHL